MKTHQYIAIATLTALSLTGCNQAELEKLRKENQALKFRNAELEATLAKMPKQLDRDLAASILRPYVAEKKRDYVSFSPEGFKSAESKGIIAEAGGFPPTYKFTPSGLSLFGALVNNSTRIELAAFGMSQPKFKLATPISEQLDEISGISGIPMAGEDFKKVEYVTDYILPQGVSQDVFQYVYSGMRYDDTVLQRYDDGWRVSDN